MAKAKTKKNPSSSRTPSSSREEKGASGIPRRWGEFLGIALLAIAALMLGGLSSFQFGEGGLMGPVGRIVAGALYAGFGMAAYLIVLGVVGMGAKALMGQEMELRLGEGIGFTAATIAGCVLLHITFPSYRVHGYTAGGLSGELLGEVSLGLFDYAGSYLVAFAVLVAGLIASTPLNFGHLLVGVRFVADGSQALLGYFWEGLMSIVRAPQDNGESQDDYEYEDEGYALEDEYEALEDEEDEEDEEAYEEEEGELEEEEEGEDAEEEPSQVIELPANKKRREEDAWKESHSGVRREGRGRRKDSKEPQTQAGRDGRGSQASQASQASHEELGSRSCGRRVARDRGDRRGGGACGG